ncbi:uncharacterized protein LOC141850453 [Brevipalpus obovatus]|uniref:uncharacterized protein LOC141850453 n=1 Tax=Brevipalpus obovatus TaxID=246614 RepID=UPI003D9ED874
MAEFKPREGLILGLGNPIMDLVSVVDDDFLNQWHLQLNVLNRGGPLQEGIEHDLLANYQVEYIAGGSVQNTLRIIQWIFNYHPHMCTLLGSVGDDDIGKRMIDEVEKNQINAVFQTNLNCSSGRCLALITHDGQCRTMCSLGGAHRYLKRDHITENLAFIDRAKIIYTTVLMFSSGEDALIELVENIKKLEDKIFCLNLGANVTIGMKFSQIERIIPFTDVIFGNDSELREYARRKKWPDGDLFLIIRKLLEIDDRKDSTKTRMIIITQGSEPVLVGTKSHGVTEFPVSTLKQSEIKDTIGAGDAFVAGFLSQMVMQKSLDQCIQMAIWTAQEIIKQSGCCPPQHSCKPPKFPILNR